MGKLTHRVVPGCTYFVTTETWQRRAVFQVADLAEIVVQRILYCRDQGTYLLHEFVLMPDHLHLLLTPGSVTSLEKAMMLIKGGSSHQIHQFRGNKMEIWQPGFHDWTIRDKGDYESKANYIRMNPVTAKLVEGPKEWHFGSAGEKYRIDEMPEKFESFASVAKATSRAMSVDVGAEAPTPYKTR
jgi:putative transposase